VTDSATTLYALLMEDDPDSLRQLEQLLPPRIAGHNIYWETCDDFDRAVERLGVRRYDIVVTDIYRDRKGQRKGISNKDERANDLIQRIRGKQFCPIVAFTDGSRPESFKETPFIKFASKVEIGDIEKKVEALILTGLPAVARRLHDELNTHTGSYLWDFLETNWQQLNQEKGLESALLERLVRRRAAIQISRLKEKAYPYEEIERIEGLEFYIYPAISEKEFRLGEVIRLKPDFWSEEQAVDFRTRFRVVLTPHCHLTTQPNDTTPRASYVLTVRAVDAGKLLAAEKKKAIQNAKTDADQLELARRITLSPADLGRPAGRYWFLPGFLEIPHLYCDFLQLESISYADLESQYESIAVLDTPFAEALQSCFLRFYSAIGLPNLGPDRFQHLLASPVAPAPETGNAVPAPETGSNPVAPVPEQ